METKEQVQKHPAVNTKNDAMMVREGIRPPLLEYNPEWHRKTMAERCALAKETKIKGLRASAPKKIIRTIPHRLTVQLNTDKKGDATIKTTYSVMLYEDQIRNYLELFFFNLKKEIKSIYFNHKNVTDHFAL